MKTLFGVIFAFSILLLLSGCITVETKSNPSVSLNVTPAFDVKVTDYKAIEDKYFQYEDQFQSISGREDCDKITESLWKDKCYVYLSMRTHDVSLCLDANFSSFDMKSKCMDEYAKYARTESDCDKITGFDDLRRQIDCGTKLAVERQDYGLCDKYMGGQDCQLKVLAASPATDSLACEEKSTDYTTYKPECLRVMAVKNKDASICSQINGDYLDSKSSFWIQSIELAKQNCFYEVALSKNDPSMCDEFSGKDYSDCIRPIAKARKDTSMCDKISDSEDREDCKVSAAVAIGDISLCEGFGSSAEYRCQSGIIVTNPSVEECRKFSNPRFPVLKELCYALIFN